MRNVLLLFAQFEREVTSERIRDKIGASKRKGLWVGGMVPLGYKVTARHFYGSVISVDTEFVSQRVIGNRHENLVAIGTKRFF